MYIVDQMLQNSTKQFYAFNKRTFLIRRIIYISNQIILIQQICIFNELTILIQRIIYIFNERITFIQRIIFMFSKDFIFVQRIVYVFNGATIFIQLIIYIFNQLFMYSSINWWFFACPTIQKFTFQSSNKPYAGMVNLVFKIF